MVPKSRALHTRSLSKPEVAPRFCEQCGTKLSKRQARLEAKYCDEVCRAEHSMALKLARRPADPRCTYCEKALDPLARAPGSWRAAAVAKNNREAPPKAKYFQRSGKVWGYEVNFFPDEDGGGYRASVPELVEEIDIIRCKTQKEGLRLIRQKIIAMREAARQ